MKFKNTRAFFIYNNPALFINGVNSEPTVIGLVASREAAEEIIETAAKKRLQRFIYRLSKEEMNNVPGAHLTLDFWKKTFIIGESFAVRGSNVQIASKAGIAVSLATRVPSRRRKGLKAWSNRLGVWLGLRNRKAASGVVATA